MLARNVPETILNVCKAVLNLGPILGTVGPLQNHEKKTKS